MKGKYGGPLSVDDFYQALYQDREWYRQRGITHLRATFVYFTPCDEHGQQVIIKDQTGNPIDGFISAGGYHCVADSYDENNLVSRTVSHPSLPRP